MKQFLMLGVVGIFSCAVSAPIVAQDLAVAMPQLEVVSPEEAGMSSEKLTKVDSAMNESVEQQLIAGGIVIVARHGKIVHFKSYGQRDIAAAKPMENDTIVRIFSMSKAITTAAAMMLYEEGKLDFE